MHDIVLLFKEVNFNVNMMVVWIILLFSCFLNIIVGLNASIQSTNKRIVIIVQTISYINSRVNPKVLYNQNNIGY